ncbi:MAG: hypothetical protein ABL963_14430 [Longimicrobiales bacterium]
MLALGSTVPVSGQAGNFSFFVTSRGIGNGANLGGLRGADQHCQSLAYALGSVFNWRAYLSAVAVDGQPAVNARDRIGPGPWHNFRGELIARDVTELHSDAANLTKESILTEMGRTSNGRGDTPNQHDILTGSNPDGTVYTGEGTTACGNWRSNAEGSARVGHHDRQGGGDNPTSWNSAHDSRGCSQEDLVGTGGNGYFYCFAMDAAQQEEEDE